MGAGLRSPCWREVGQSWLGGCSALGQWGPPGAPSYHSPRLLPHKRIKALAMQDSYFSSRFLHSRCMSGAACPDGPPCKGPHRHVLAECTPTAPTPTAPNMEKLHFATANVWSWNKITQPGPLRSLARSIPSPFSRETRRRLSLHSSSVSSPSSHQLGDS